MENQELRASDRVYMEIPIVISGTDSTGRNFVENARTLVLSRKGAKIISKQPLAPRQKITIRCLKTGQNTRVQVVGPIVGDEEGCHFGVAFLEEGVNVWGINFPSLDGIENPAGRVFLECADCHAQEVVHLDVFELEVLLANECLTRPCMRCRLTTLWIRSALKEGQVPIRPKAANSRHTTQERRSPRIKLKVVACLRQAAMGEEVVSTENVSRGGFRFISQKDYPIGTVIEAALPYTPGAANIFTPARVVYKEAGAIEMTYAHGVAYIQAPVARSLTGYRITQPK